MYLAELSIEGFRRISSLTLKFRPGLNVMVGPNNVGKTAVIDGLRALLSSAEDGSLRIDDADLHIDPIKKTKAKEISFHYVFRGLSLEEEADFLTALKPCKAGASTSDGEYEAHINIRYSGKDSGGRLRPKRWCGDHEENGLTSDMLEDLRAVYLQPLRDPASGLRPSRSSQLARLIDRLSDDIAKEKLVTLLAKYDEDLKKEKPVLDTQTAVQGRHEMMLGDLLKQLLDVGLAPPDFQRLAARLSLIVENQELEQNGLGYNNLIFMAVVLSELSLNPDAAYKGLIVEEPEAHLHPQMQAVLLEYLESLEKSSKDKTNTEKVIQIFLTSHSPNFASIANIDSIGCLHQGETETRAFFPRLISFEKTKKEKLQRYLDVTRAELFFARRIIFVEGEAERFMLSVLAKKLNVDLRKNAISVLSADGLNFDSFMPLFGKDSLNIRTAILTDADPPKTASYPGLGDALVLSTAATSIKDAANEFVKPFFAQKTFEYDLALHLSNHDLMLNALEQIHPNIASDLKNHLKTVDDKQKPQALFKGIFDRGEGVTVVQKGAYAQALAQIIDDETKPFTVPAYVKDAIEFVSKDA